MDNNDEISRIKSELSKSIDLQNFKQVLTEDEINTVEKILQELSESGNSCLLSNLYEVDYEEIPVSIDTFLTDKKYLGNSFVDDEGKSLLYPYWNTILKDIFAPASPYYETILSGAIGVGKTTIAIIGMCYILYRLLCLKDPAKYFRLSGGSKVALAFINIDMNAAYGVGYDRLQKYVKASPWFLEHGSLIGIKHPTYYPGKNIELVVGSKSQHFIGRDIESCIIDEVNFMPGSNPKMELSKAMSLYTTIKRRMESRYMKMGKLPGMLFLCSSKNSDMDFLEQYIKSQKDKPYIKLVDEPVWVIKSGLGLYSGKTFDVAVGNRYRLSKILDNNENSDDYTKNGQQVIHVPIEYKDAFGLDINTSLTDIAGIAITSNLKYIYYDKLKLSYRTYLVNPFSMNTIELGFDDESEIADYFLPDKMSRFDVGKPHCIHWDTSKSGDATGLSMSTVVGNKEVKKLKGDSVYSEEDIVYKVEFAIRIRPKPGNEIPFYKIRNFIYYLRDSLNYNIVRITCDSFQSVDTLQQFSLRGYDSRVLSVDRSRTPYETIKNAINEERILMPQVKELEDEFLCLEDDKVRGKIDHPASGSKDVADAVTGSVFDLLSYKNLLSDTHYTTDIQSTLQANESSTGSSDFDWILSPGTRIIPDR
jgi:hypothetical protein